LIDCNLDQMPLRDIIEHINGSNINDDLIIRIIIVDKSRADVKVLITSVLGNYILNCAGSLVRE
jgi:hypothetical protein